MQCLGKPLKKLVSLEFTTLNFSGCLKITDMGLKKLTEGFQGLTRITESTVCLQADKS